MLLHICILIVLHCLCSFQLTGDTKAKGHSDEEAEETENDRKTEIQKDGRTDGRTARQKDRKTEKTRTYCRQALDGSRIEHLDSGF